MRAIESCLPEADVVARESAELQAPPERALALALECPAAPDLLTRTLLTLRGLPPRGTLDEFLHAYGFEELARTPTELVVGLAGKPWLPSGGLRSFAEAGPGTVRIALSLEATGAGPGRTLLLTETRVAAADERARRAFAGYWRLVGPLSGLVRRRWLAAVRRRAARP